MPTRTRVYIDGFNLYHGLIRPHRAHWLDLSAFAMRLNRGLPVDQVIYCTAQVSGTVTDPGKADRQDGYLRALKIACPNVEVVLGQFSSHKKAYPLHGCKNDPTCAIFVWSRSEKGSDVNLASRLLHDAHLQRFDRAIVVSGDSDLVEPIRLITADLARVVWVRNPRSVDSKELAAVATDYDRIKPAVALNSQLPSQVTNGEKTYAKPAKWDTSPSTKVKTPVTSWTCTQPDCGKQSTCFRYEPAKQTG